jgi:hypothetical protein
MQLPRWGGAGPIAWRQLIGAVRSSRALLILLIIIGIAAGTFVLQHRGGSVLFPGKTAGRRRVDEHGLDLDAQVRLPRRTGPPGSAPLIAHPPDRRGGGGVVHPRAGSDHDAGTLLVAVNLFQGRCPKNRQGLL